MTDVEKCKQEIEAILKKYLCKIDCDHGGDHYISKVTKSGVTDYTVADIYLEMNPTWRA